MPQDEKFTLSQEKFLELAGYELDGIQAALQHLGVAEQELSRSTDDNFRIRDTRGAWVNGATLTWGPVQAIVTQGEPKNPSQFSDFLVCWIGVGFSVAAELWRKYRPMKVRLHNGHVKFLDVAAKLKALHDVVVAALQAEQDRKNERLRNLRGSRELVNRLAAEFGLELDEYELADWSRIHEGMLVEVCREPVDTVQIVLLAPDRDSCIKASSIAALQEAVPEAEVRVACSYERVQIWIKAQYEPAVKAIRALAAINPHDGSFFQEGKE
jgi:hypothetical protein